MSVSELKSHLQLMRVSNLFSLSHRFNVEPNLLRDMLGLLIRKGMVRRCLKTSNCGTKCQRCSPLITEIYEWVDVKKREMNSLN